MACPSGKLECPGPYKKETCEGCEAKYEGDRCARTGKADGKCKGPFSDTACGYCQQYKKNDPKFSKEAFSELVKTRSKTRVWRKSLNLESVKLLELYKKGDYTGLTPGQIDQKYQIEAALRTVDCPWIKIGNLYVTVTTGNDAGWGDLVKKLLANDTHSLEAKRFAIFTGRHGNTQGTLTASDSGLFSDKVPDKNHLTQDIVAKAGVEKCYAALSPPDRPQISIWDVGTTAGATMTRTKILAIERLAAGDVVIFAWCWSLLSPYKVNETSPEAVYEVYEQDQPYNKTIENIVNESYGWATAAINKNSQFSSKIAAITNPYLDEWKKKASDVPRIHS